ncbi:MAG TPA: hypothetical protein VGT44_03225 [Ktedonobacteraceae bacterium]|nr:hypothetical protein [Ktedonobacteraceae bacterium]
MTNPCAFSPVEEMLFAFKYAPAIVLVFSPGEKAPRYYNIVHFGWQCFDDHRSSILPAIQKNGNPAAVAVY